jgi:hypothetical protein
MEKDENFSETGKTNFAKGCPEKPRPAGRRASRDANGANDDQATFTSMCRNMALRASSSFSVLNVC